MKHDENVDLRLIAKKCNIVYGRKLIKASKNTCIGIKTWGRIDFLCHYCGYTFMWDTAAVIDKSSYEDNNNQNTANKLKRKFKYHTNDSK